MANNRLFLYDPESHEAFLLAKSSGQGWCPAPRYELDDILARLQQWCAFRDAGASYGNCEQLVTRLQLRTEADLPEGATLNQEVDDRR